MRYRSSRNNGRNSIGGLIVAIIFLIFWIAGVAWNFSFISIPMILVGCFGLYTAVSDLVREIKRRKRIGDSFYEQETGIPAQKYAYTDRFCPYCGEGISEEFSFCPKCGNRVK